MPPCRSLLSSFFSFFLAPVFDFAFLASSTSHHLRSHTSAPMGQFDWFSSIGATDEAVAVLNDQPILFTILLIVLVTLILQFVLHWYIGYVTLKPEQRKAMQAKKDKKAAAKQNKGKK
ncbi:hypothetical protein BKA56DRAFT_667168 [Ilyonectria sp. MPI-CAGE-AT-0026]|nr:hypothetical protein BKA56DRAFT_667168 [Ilyonectria sp. MPI-CAGE-AT-0026]